MIVREAVAEDAPEIASIWNHYIRHTTNTFTSAQKTEAELAQMIAARSSEGRAVLVAEEAMRVIGFATYFPFRGGPGYAHTAEHSVMLDEAARGRGVGRALMEALEHHAENAGVHTLIAAVSADNSAGVRFHERLGYQIVGCLPEVGRKFDRWIDLILLQKHLRCRTDNPRKTV